MRTTAFLIRVLICFLLSLIPLNEQENQIYSARLSLKGRRAVAQDIWIIDLAGKFPDAPLLQTLLAKNPDAILVTWPTGGLLPSLDEPRVIWSSQFDSEGRFQKPPPAYSSGFNHLVADGDGVIRRSVLLKQHPGTEEYEPSLAWKAYALRHGSELRKSRRPGEAHLINFMGPPGSVRSCRYPCEDMGDAAGRILLLTQDNDPSESERTFRTPLGEMTRAEILANEVDTVVNRHSIYRASLIEQCLIILAMILGAAFYIIYYPVVISAVAIIGTGLGVVIVLFQLIFHLFDIYIPSMNVAASLLITYLVFTGYRLAFQENLQWRSLKQAQYLKELDQMKTNFLSLVSHDLKTPLAKIQAMVERLRRESDLPPDGRKELLDSIENSNNELKHYITSILNLSRMESQKVILNKKSNDINRIIQQAMGRLRPLAQSKGIRVEESLEPLFSIECDENLMTQVITNLIDNAIKFSPQNSRVLLRTREEEGFVRVDVEDFGPGIPKDQLPLMFRKFSRFVRPQGTVKEQVKGTGLGLYLSKYFIELHGGTIRVKSIEGQGTTFTFTLPLQGEESETLLG